MELGLVQLALTHLLAAKAGSWALAPKRDRSSQCQDKQSTTHNNKALTPQSTRARHKRSNGRTPRTPRGKNPPEVAPGHPELTFSTSNPARDAIEAMSPQQKARRRRSVPPTAWMLAGHSSSVPMALPWAGRKPHDHSAAIQRQRLAQQACQRDPQLPHSTESSSSCGQSTSEDQSSSNGPSLRDLPRGWGLPKLQAQVQEPLVGWHLDDEPRLQLEPSEARGLPGTAMVAGLWAAASRLLGGGGGAGGGGNAESAADDDVTAPDPAKSSEPVTQPHPHDWKATPHLVGSHALGVEGGGPGGTAAGTGGISGRGGGGGGGGTAAAAAAALTSAGGALGDLAERAVEVPVRSLRELNRVVTAGVSDFLASDSGRRLSEQVAAEMSTGALMAPVYLTEELVKARLKSLLRSHARWIATFLAVRVSLATAALHCTKAIVRRSVRDRGPRWLRSCVHFVCDVMLPTGFFGPLLGVTAAVLQLTGLGGVIFHRGGAGTASSGGSGGASGGGGGGGVVGGEGRKGTRVGSVASGAARGSTGGRTVALPVLISPSLPFSLLLLPPLPLTQQQQQRGRASGPSGASAGSVVGSVTTGPDAARAAEAGGAPPSTGIGKGLRTGTGAGSLGEVLYTAEVWS